jgi:hypothetical protein
MIVKLLPAIMGLLAEVLTDGFAIQPELLYSTQGNL